MVLKHVEDLDEKADLDEESQSFLHFVNQIGALDINKPLKDIRDDVEKIAHMLKGDFSYQGTKGEKTIPTIKNGISFMVPITILTPKLQFSGTTINNILIYFHGGGFTFGSRTTHMKFCEMISERCECVVVNVEYRLAPEHKFPACYKDAEAVVRWCLSNKSTLTGNAAALVGVAGDSAGGNISASVCHLVQGLDYQVLIYPSLSMAARTIYPSYVKYGEGYFLTASQMLWFLSNFLSSMKEAEDVLCSPMYRKSFAGLPPALFVVSECDPLADESLEYKKKLQSGGVKTEYKLLKGTLHGYASLPGHFKNTTEEAVQGISTFLSKL